MSAWLTILVIALLLAAIGVQVYYVRGLSKAGVEVTTTTKVVVYLNIGLLTLVVLGVLAYAIYSQTLQAGV